MSRMREFPTDPAELPHAEYDPWVDDDRDETILDLMEDVLDERETYVLDALLFEKLSLREVGRRLSLSKTQVARLRDQALQTLRAELILKKGI